MVKKLNQDITWTTNLGNAFLNQQADVMDAVHCMRERAESLGKLASTSQQTVSSNNDSGRQVIVIQPSDPQVIYVPEYAPTYIWGPPLYYPYASWYYPRAYFGFGIGIPIGAYFGAGWGGWGGWGWSPGWGGRSIIINNNFMHRYNFNAARARLQFDEDFLSPNRVSFSVGEQDWPFPVPLVRKDGMWRMDAQAGGIEILARRIGRNELNAIEACSGYVEAQLDYAAASHDGDGRLKYAQTIFASAGKQDRLYLDGSPHSLVSRAFADAATASLSTSGKPVEPYHGYYFRVLKSQGPDATGGAFDYLVSGRMIGGFALVGWPADYGVCGIHTLIINHHGLVYQKDLGRATPAQARQIIRFNPDKTWRPVVLE